MSIYRADHQHDLPTIALVKFCGAQADPYVNYLAMVMLKPFQLSVRGQRNIATALSNLPVRPAVDERLCFGWGFENVIRSPAVHREGYEHLAVMAALSATFHESYAAEVLYAMASMTAGPDDMTPHKRQWRSQLRSCNGVFVPYDFDALVEDYIRLDPFSFGPGSNPTSRRCIMPAKDLARGLLALSQVIAGKQKQIILVGGGSIGWVAALCEWLYDLRVIVLSPTGTHLHGSASKENAQVVLVYNVHPILEVHTDLDKLFSGGTMDADDPGYSKYVHFLPFGGRVLWQSLLPRVFGQAFHHLDHEEASTLATAIGAAARALEGGVKTAKDSDPILPENRCNEAAYGAGLVVNITSWLPELRKGQGRMERQLKKSYEEAAATYHEKIATVATVCHCNICAVTGTERPPRNGFCLPVIVETIIALGLAISRMIVSPGVYPTREGIQELYNSQAEKRSQAKHLDPRSAESFTVIYGNEWNASSSRRLQNAVALFSGRPPMTDVPDTLIALAHEGVVAYMLALERADTSPPRKGDEGVIRILSGAINVREKIFSRISTEPVASTTGDEDWTWEEWKFDHWSKPLYLK